MSHTCDTCGALVADEARHAAHHQAVTDALGFVNGNTNELAQIVAELGLYAAQLANALADLYGGPIPGLVPLTGQEPDTGQEPAKVIHLRPGQTLTCTLCEEVIPADMRESHAATHEATRS